MTGRSVAPHAADVRAAALAAGPLPKAAPEAASERSGALPRGGQLRLRACHALGRAPLFEHYPPTGTCKGLHCLALASLHDVPAVRRAQAATVLASAALLARVRADPSLMPNERYCALPEDARLAFTPAMLSAEHVPLLSQAGLRAAHWAAACASPGAVASDVLQVMARNVVYTACVMDAVTAQRFVFGDKGFFLAPAASSRAAWKLEFSLRPPRSSRGRAP